MLRLLLSFRLALECVEPLVPELLEKRPQLREPLYETRQS